MLFSAITGLEVFMSGLVAQFLLQIDEWTFELGVKLFTREPEDDDSVLPGVPPVTWTPAYPWRRTYGSTCLCGGLLPQENLQAPCFCWSSVP